ncbi:MAG: ATP-binding protein, partial [Bacteroidota bacterium]
MSAVPHLDHALLDSLYRHSALAVFLVEVDEDAPLAERFTFVELNPVHERLSGFTTAWIRGRTPRDLSPRIPMEFALAVEARYQSCVEARADISYEEMIPFEGRETWWITTLNPVTDAQGRIIRLIGFANEITERKRLELELESERRAQIRFGDQLRHLHRLGTSTYADTTALCDAHLGAGSAMFDLPLGIVSTFGEVPQPAGSALPPETPYIVAAVVSPDGALQRGTRFALDDMLCAAVAEQRATVAYHNLAAEPHLHDHPCYTDLGIAAYISTPIWVRGALHGTLNFSSTTPRSAPFSNHDVELIELMADSIGHALELAEAEASLMEAKQGALLARDAAEAANHAKTAFLSTMSHEVRTPLNGVLGFAELLRMDPALSDEHRSHADVIISSGERLVALINDVLDLASVEAKRLHLERAPVDVHDLVAEHLQVHAARAGAKGLELSYEIAPEVPAVLLGDERRLGQVLSNLVANAIKFTQRGYVRVCVDTVPAPEAARLLRFGVEDTGIGIGADSLAQVFEPFFQADSSISRHYEGSGLGLSICHEFIQAMGGEIRAESTVGIGSRFTFTIPLATPPRRREIITVTSQASLAGRRALVVDDNGTNRDLLSALLSRWAMDVTTVCAASEARALFAAQAFDVGLLDYGLAASSGSDLARALRADGIATPLMLLTSYDLPQVEDTEVFEAVLAKPLDTAALERALQRVLQRVPPAPSPQPAAPTPALWISKGRAAGSRRAPDAYEGLRVIVAEDDPANRTLAHAMLAELGVGAVFVEDG